jgi:hypothetical protein
MIAVVTRRTALTVAIQNMPEPIRARDLAAANAAAGFGAARNTARLDARALVARGLLAPLPGPGNRTYTRCGVQPPEECPGCKAGATAGHRCGR